MGTMQIGRSNAIVGSGQGTRRFIRGLVKEEKIGTQSIVISPNGRIVKQDPKNIPPGCTLVDITIDPSGFALAGHTFNPNLQALETFENNLDIYNRSVKQQAAAQAASVAV